MKESSSPLFRTTQFLLIKKFVYELELILSLPQMTGNIKSFLSCSVVVVNARGVVDIFLLFQFFSTETLMNLLEVGDFRQYSKNLIKFQLTLQALKLQKNVKINTFRFKDSQLTKYHNIKRIFSRKEDAYI